MPAVADALRRELDLDPHLHDPDLAVARGAALYGEKKELERMVAADLRTRGRLRDGEPLENAASPDLDDACRRVADAYGVPLAQVRRAVEIQVDTVVSRGFGVLAINALAGRLEPSWLVHRNDRLPIRTSRSYGTVRRDQSEIQLTVVEQQGQAESSRPEDAKVLIVGEITGIPPGYDEASEVRVTFEMGFDGVLHVTAFHVDAAIPLVLETTTGATLSQAEVARERDQLGRTRRRD
jgi:molecular chaperone DnaK